jgi:hypothetical protein
MTDEPIRPRGIGVQVTTTGAVKLQFDHGAIPEIILTSEGAHALGSHVGSAADKADKIDE